MNFLLPCLLQLSSGKTYTYFGHSHSDSYLTNAQKTVSKFHVNHVQN